MHCSVIYEMDFYETWAFMIIFIQKILSKHIPQSLELKFDFKMFFSTNILLKEIIHVHSPSVIRLSLTILDADHI